MERIGLYSQLTDFTTEHAGTAEWCTAERDGKKYFVKKFQSPVYPSKDIGLPEKMYNAGVAEFKDVLTSKRVIYQRLRECDQSGVLIVPVEVINYQFHICTIAEYVTGNVAPEQIHALSEWQRLVLMRTLTLALINVHKAGVVHSDMKPDNVLIFQDEKGHCRLRLIDFDGSFLESNPPTEPEDVVGDPAYFAPEAYMLSMDEDIHLDHRIDIFALGIIFHYFWCGKFPDKPVDQTIGECLLRDGSITLDESIPPVLRQLINKMITAEPDDRLPLKSIYDVLGVQVAHYTPTVINLQPEKTVNPPPTPLKEKKVEVRINCCSESGEVLKYRTLKISYGSKKVVEAEDIKGYHIIGLKTKEIEVDSKGFVTSPIVFTYKKNDETDVKKNGKGKKALFIILSLFIAYWIIMYSLSMNAYNSSRYNEAKQYMDLTPLFSSFFESTYNHTQQMLDAGTSDRGTSITTTRANTQAPTIATINTGTTTVSVNAGQTTRVKFVAPSAGTYIFTSIGGDDTYGYLYNSATNSTALRSDDDSGNDQNFKIEYAMSANQTIYLGVKYYSTEKRGTILLDISKKAARTFELNPTVSSNKGRVTVSWTDSSNNSPYTVAFQYIGSGNVTQPFYWANGDKSGSTTYSKSFTIDHLIPGKTYRIEVEDRSGASITRTYTLPTPASFIDGKLKASSIRVKIAPRQKNSSSDYSSASSIRSLRSTDIISNRGSKDYGFRYDINYPQLAYSRTYYTQVAITAPNGYVECEVHDDIQYGSEYSGHCWYLIGDWTFRMIYEKNSSIPTGTWSVDLYWDGMHVNQSTFSVQ